MAYYNPNAYGLDASASENLQPINVPPVNRYLIPKGIEVGASVTTGNQGRHAGINHAEYIPLVVDTTSTYDRIGISYVGANSCVDTWYYDLALYDGNIADEYPSTKLADLGTIQIVPGTTATGAQIITINQTLQANKLYFLAIGIRFSSPTDFMANRTPFLVQQQGSFAMFAKRGLPNAAGASHGFCWFEQLGTYSGTHPATMSYATNQAVSTTSPRLALRRSA
jgi:hypothetical protein